MPSTGPTQFITMRGAVLTLAPTEADLEVPASNLDASCQIIDAHVTSTTQTETAPATLCADAVDSIIGITDSLELTAFQDWANPTGLCWYLQTNRLEEQWFRLALPEGGDYTGVVNLARRKRHHEGSASETRSSPPSTSLRSFALFVR